MLASLHRSRNRGQRGPETENKALIKEIHGGILGLVLHSLVSPKSKQSEIDQLDPSGQNCRKSNVEECIFDQMALHIECRFNKNSLLKCYFLSILLAGMLIIHFQVHIQVVFFLISVKVIPILINFGSSHNYVDSF